jgi:hypothetical protein
MIDLYEAISFALIDIEPLHSPISFPRRFSSSESRCDGLRDAQAVSKDAVNKTVEIKIEVRIGGLTDASLAPLFARRVRGSWTHARNLIEIELTCNKNIGLLVSGILAQEPGYEIARMG